MVYADNAQRGPYSVSQLENFRRNGELPIDALVWTEGMSDWQPIATVLTTPPIPPRAATPQMAMRPVSTALDAGVKESDYTFLLITHILMGVAIFTGLTSLVALIMAYVKQPDVRGTYLESHCKWVIETFWWSFWIGIIGVILSFVVIGVPILIALSIWYIYRVVMGAIRISERRAL